MRTVTIHLGPDDTLDAVLCGELDFTNAAAVTTAVREAATRHRPRTVRVDLAEVTFLDSSGIGVLVKAMHVAQEVGARFVVQRACDKVRDQLNMTGLLEVFGLAGHAPGPE